MRTTDTAFFSVLIGGSNATTANILINYDIAHWCSVRIIENEKHILYKWKSHC
jgi:uncharacterized protein (DUF4213/DUF364 family)